MVKSRKAWVFAWIFLSNIGLVYSQTSPDKLIDSLNLTEGREERIALSLEIASRIMHTDWDRTIWYLDLAEKEARKTPDEELNLAKVYMGAAKIYHSKDALDIALDYYLKAYEIYNSHDKVLEVAKIENNLAIIYAQGNNPENSLQFFEHVYQNQVNNKDTINQVKVLNNMGTLYLKENVDSSLYYFGKALDILQYIKRKDLDIYVYTNFGRAYGLKGDSTMATMYFQKASSLLDEELDTSLKTFVFQSLAEYHLGNDNLEAAIANGLKGIGLIKEDLYNFTGQRFSQILYHAYLGQEDYPLAARYFQLYDGIRDSLNVEEKAVNLERLRLEQDYKSREKIEELSEDKRKSQLYVVGLLLVIGILILTILLIRYRNSSIKNQLEREILNRKQEDLKQSLDAKNKMLVGKAMTEIHRADIINGISDDLKELKLNSGKRETQEAIDYIQRRLQKNENTQIWKEFEISFEQVHQSFYENLNKQHPNLSPKDRRLCALLSLDLSTKEISQITGQSFKSVENARTRLRKKLEITHERLNISTYLNTFSADSPIE
ncbi:tetratricopeptide repeat protein [Echinicola pacifica]|uniref:tetratricopeptide repeat protein n=1 Tax=Echinicola pacifica TaxID=346377 RepID=UPI00036BB51D|nr:hypothetical protein [Echinicola pacifica]